MATSVVEGSSRCLSSVAWCCVILYLSLISGVLAVAPLPVDEKPKRPIHLIVAEGIPFVPEEFREPSNNIFRKLDFSELRYSDFVKNKQMENIILNLVQNWTESHPDNEMHEAYETVELKYIGRGTWTNKGHNSRLAVTFESEACQPKNYKELQIEPKCHIRKCHMELNETFMPPPWPLGEDIDSRRMGISITKWSCARKDRWCYACHSDEEHIHHHEPSDSNGNGHVLPSCSSGLHEQDENLHKLNCNREYGDLPIHQRYVCGVKFSQVAGAATDIRSRSCRVMSLDELQRLSKANVASAYPILDQDQLFCSSKDPIQYEMDCICSISGCNGNALVQNQTEIIAREGVQTALSADLNKSIQQLRADVERMLKKYSIRQP